MQHFQIKNWSELQHYKDRAPPWIKLYNHLLDDYEFSCLQDASKLHLMLIWLLASRNNNKLPFNEKWIQQRIGVDSKVDLSEILEAGFIEIVSADGALHIPAHDASNVLSDSKQLADTEREERESRAEQRESRADTPKSAPRIKKPDSFKAFFSAYPPNKKGGTDTTAWNKSKTLGLTDDDFKTMLIDVQQRQINQSSWYQTYAPGITKYLSEQIWLTPVVPDKTIGSSNDQWQAKIDARNLELGIPSQQAIIEGEVVR